MVQSEDSLCSVQCLGFKSTFLRWPWKSQTNQEGNGNGNADQKSVCKPAWTWNLCQRAKKPCCNPTKFSVSLFQTSYSEKKYQYIMSVSFVVIENVPTQRLGIPYISHAYVLFQL